MRLRDAFLLTAALCMLSALLGVIVLVVLYATNPQLLDSVALLERRAQGPTEIATVAPSATPLPPVVTPTPTAEPTPTWTVPSPTATEPPTHTPLPPTATHTPLPTPTSTLAPSATLTETVDPDGGIAQSVKPTPTTPPPAAARLARAHQAKRIGDYELARQEFGAALETTSDPGESAEALYELGVCASLDDAHQTAREVLARFVAAYPADHRVPAAYWFLAESSRALGDLDRAREEYQAYVERQDVLADLVHTRVGEIESALGDHVAAADAYQRALAYAPDLGQQYDLREQIGLAYADAGHYDEAIEWLTGIAERSVNVQRLARIWYQIGQVHRRAGREQEALDAFAQAVYGDPRAGYAYTSLIELLEARVLVDEFQRGLINYHAGSYVAAVAAFERYMNDTPDYDSDAHYYAALSHLSAGAYDLAVRECELALSRFPATISHWGELWLSRARALEGQDRPDDAVAAYLEFADAHPAHPLAADAYWEAAQLRAGQGRMGDAASLYTALADRHPNAERAPLARYRAGICRYRDQDLDAALAAWGELAGRYPATSEAVAARYWRGKVLWALGMEAEARGLLTGLAEEHPRHYYGLRAAALLASAGRIADWPAAPAAHHFSADEQLLRLEADAWLREWLNLPAELDPAVIPPEMAANLHLRRGIEFLTLGLRAAARDEFELLRRQVSQDPLALYRLALLTRDLGLYAPSLRAAIALVGLAPVASVLETPVLIQRLTFPTYFADLVVAESTAYQIDPLVMFALIRQESVFDDQITSWAGAVGLAQIMPSTGAWIAGQMPWPEYEERDLGRAYVNVRFGAWFLARILEMTDGDVWAALAGYNGGPTNSTRWLEASGGDPDLFLEVIDRDEPYLYVREIYRHYDVYVRLYGGAPR
ncbi:MAG: tetratricopeptide repeat protein [Anaerolineae bacterium]|nr:tetratricopeptide repeat protein [Anaerolineae bacterium]